MDSKKNAVEVAINELQRCFEKCKQCRKTDQYRCCELDLGIPVGKPPYKSNCTTHEKLVDAVKNVSDKIYSL